MCIQFTFSRCMVSCSRLLFVAYIYMSPQSQSLIANQTQNVNKHTTIKQKYISYLCLHFRLFHPPLSCPFREKWSQMTTMTRMNLGCLVLISTADRTQSEESYLTNVKPHSWLWVLLFVAVTLHNSGFISSRHR